MNPSLRVVMYHYVRDLPNTGFPRIKGMLTSEFRRQLAHLRASYEMATLESALDYLQGVYTPRRDLCLLTFDDGLKDHYTDVTPLLLDHDIQGMFFLITSCLHDGQMVPVHMNHFLMATLDFPEYRQAFLDGLTNMSPDSKPLMEVDEALAQRTYRWDAPDVAAFKYLFNFVLDDHLRDSVLKNLFTEKLGDVRTFGRELYLNAAEARKMQAAGMILGGHSHRHKPLSSLSDDELETDLKTCHQILLESLYPQPFWPFCYPYGKQDSFTAETSRQLQQLGFCCSFSTEIGLNMTGGHLFELRRLDCKDVSM
jgi:peptidoglycan/xylan/chitin deacetylase (PgdA/CDA1 family)